jgi:hypothetical protein
MRAAGREPGLRDRGETAGVSEGIVSVAVLGQGAQGFVSRTRARTSRARVSPSAPPSGVAASHLARDQHGPPCRGRGRPLGTKLKAMVGAEWVPAHDPARGHGNRRRPEVRVRSGRRRGREVCGPHRADVVAESSTGRQGSGSRRRERAGSRERTWGSRTPSGTACGDAAGPNGGGRHGGRKVRDRPRGFDFELGPVRQ